MDVRECEPASQRACVRAACVRVLVPTYMHSVYMRIHNFKTVMYCTVLCFQARDTFAVISSQVTEYMRNKNITPNKPHLNITESLNSRESLLHYEENADTVSLRSVRHSISNVSMYNSLTRRLSGISGPKCPTCGSTLESANGLLSEISNVGWNMNDTLEANIIASSYGLTRVNCSRESVHFACYTSAKVVS